MWLLDTLEHHLHNFAGKPLPKYAVLSHRWQKQEVSFKRMHDAGMIVEDEDVDHDNAEDEDMGDDVALPPRNMKIEKFPLLVEQQNFNRGKLVAMKGWSKIVDFCRVAFDCGLQYAWIDTCCIDKSSSAELQEAINSMWKWYKESEICIVFMNDVQIRSAMKNGHLAETTTEEFCNSEWFGRGWTLQELIAPGAARLQFFDSTWHSMGSGLDLWPHINKASGIPMATTTCCIAQKMSWAAKRKTTRPEDMAYCLMGLFGVNMPLLYGEGLRKAFRRLQEEILKRSIDPSILAWDPVPEFAGLFDRRALATSPQCFEARGLTKSVYLPLVHDYKRHMTPLGLQINLHLHLLKEAEWPFDVQECVASYREKQKYHQEYKIYSSPLACSTDGQTEEMLFAFYLHRGESLYSRIGKCHERSFKVQRLLRDYTRHEIVVMEPLVN